MKCVIAAPKIALCIVSDKTCFDWLWLSYTAVWSDFSHGLIMSPYCRTTLTFCSFLGEGKATGEDFDQEEASDSQHCRGVKLHTTRGIKCKCKIHIHY